MPDLEKRALVGMHDENARNWVSELAFRGYNITKVYSIPAMIDSLRSSRYDLIMMDINLGLEGQSTYTPAQMIYNNKGGAKFLSLTALDKDFIKTVPDELYCFDKLYPQNIMDFLDTI